MIWSRRAARASSAIFGTGRFYRSTRRPVRAAIRPAPGLEPGGETWPASDSGSRPEEICSWSRKTLMPRLTRPDTQSVAK